MKANYKNIKGYLHFMLEDDKLNNLEDNLLLNSVKYMSEIIKGGNDTLIHCSAGLSRSGYFNCALHMALYEMNFEDALSHIRLSRPQTDPNPAFVSHLEKLESQLMTLLI